MKLQRIIIIVALALAVAYCAIPVASSLLHRDDWKKETSPLSEDTVSNLCRVLSLKETDSLCNGSKAVYALDFSRALRSRFPLEDPMETPKNKATITFQNVDNVLGPYKVECQSVERASQYSYFRCLYDLRGDGYWIDAFYFYYPEQTLFSIRSGSSRDD